MADRPCDKCGRLVVDASTSWDSNFTLRPDCQGIRVEGEGGKLLTYVTREELQDFLDRAYGRR